MLKTEIPQSYEAFEGFSPGYIDGAFSYETVF